MKQFVVEIAPTVNADGSTSTFLFGTRSWRTKPTDTPANTRVRGLLKNPGTLKRELFSRARVTGAIAPSFGNIVLNNKASLRDGAGPLDEWIDYGISGSLVTVRWGDRDAAYPAGYTTVYIAYAAGFLADSDELTIRLRDQLQLLDQPIVSEGFAGTGGLEGGQGIAKRKQFVSQDPGFIEPILIDAVRQIYFVQSTSAGGLHDQWLTNGSPINPFDVFDNAVEITRVSPNYSTAADIVATAPAPGYVRYYFGPASATFAGWRNGPVYFRLGSPPAGDVRVFATGYPTDADAARIGVAWGTFAAHHLAARAGVPAANLDLAGFALAVGPQVVNDARTFADVLDDSALALQGWYGFNRLNVFRSGYLLDPNSNEIFYGASSTIVTVPSNPSTSVHTFTEAGISDLKRHPVPDMESPGWAVSMLSGDTAPSRIATGATDTMRDYLSREVWWSATGRVPAIKLADPGALTETVRMRGRYIQNDFDRDLWMARWFALYGGRRHFFTFTAPLSATLLALDLHDCVTLQHRRFGLSSGVKFRIVGITIDCSTKVPQMRFVLWGGSTGTYVPIPGGGSGDPPATVNPVADRALIAPFTGFMYGSVEVGGGAGAGASAAAMGDFTQVMYGDAGATNDPLFSYVNALFHFETGHDWDDSSASAYTTSRSGMTIGAAKFGAGGADFSGTGYFYWTCNTAGILDTSDLCIEAFINADATQPNSYPSFLQTYPGTGTNWLAGALSIGVSRPAGETNKITLYIYNYSTTVALLTSTNGIVGSGWKHVAITRSGNTWRLFIDGVLEATATWSGSVHTAAQKAYIGGDPWSGADGLKGQIDELRITVGQARYTAAFTPPPAPFPNSA